MCRYYFNWNPYKIVTCDLKVLRFSATKCHTYLAPSTYVDNDTTYKWICCERQTRYESKYLKPYLLVF